ncbi:MAG: hypothetical protein WC571_00035 [Candidatus Omnitrophota bacterium]
MENKDPYFHLEYFLTFLLFLPLLLLFPQEATALRVFFVGGIILGSSVAYISRNQLYLFKKFVILAASILILTATVYFVFKSAFLYREVIVICIKSLSLLIVVHSFGSCLQGCLNSMQIFSILLFLCLCALIRGYNNFSLFLTSLFTFNLLALARIRLHALFDNPEKAREKYQGINIFFIIVLVLSILSAWVFFINLPLGKIEILGYLKEEGLNSTEGQAKGKGVSLTGEQIQKELTSLTFRLYSTDEMYRVLAAIQDLLVKEKPFALEVDKARGDIAEIFSNPALAQEAVKVKELSDSIKAYMGEKILNNLTRIKDSISKIIDDNHIGLRQRFSLLSSANKLEYSNSLEEINKNSEQLRSAVNEDLISDEARKKLKQLDKQLREWKAYQVYSRKLDSFQKEINNLDEDRKSGFNKLAQQIRDVNTVPDSAKVDKLIEKMSQGSFLEDEKLIDKAEDLLKLKKVMIALKEVSQLRRELEDSGQSIDKPPELEEALNAAEESGDPREILRKISKLTERMRQESYFQIPRGARDILQAKIESLAREAADALKNKIQESGLADSGENLLEDLKAMDSERTKDKITVLSAKMQKALEVFYKQGSITKETVDNLVGETKKIEEFFTVSSELANMGRQKRALNKDIPLDYKEKAAKFLQNLSSGDEQKERIKKLVDKLGDAQTISQAGDVSEVINEEIDALARKGEARDSERIKKFVQQAVEERKMFILEKESCNLRKEIEVLKSGLPQQAALLESRLNKLRGSKTEQELLKNASALKELSESKQFEKEFESDEFSEMSDRSRQLGRMKIDLLPGYVILPLQSRISLKSVAVYDNFVKEISPELEWSSSDSSIASVNQFGLVYARGIGEAEITCRYGGLVSRRCKVTVVATIPEREFAFIKSELGI